MDNKVCGKCFREVVFINGKCLHCGSSCGLIDRPIVKKMKEAKEKKGKKGKG